MKSKLLAGSLALVVSASVWAATDTSTVGVIIENQAITLVNDVGLNFGTILPFGRNGSVRVNTSGQPTATDAHISDASAITASSWSVSGVPGAPFSVTLPANNTVQVTNGTEQMTVTSFTRGGGLVLDAAGNAGFTVGATLLVGANQPEGTYNGTFDVTVVYN